MSNAIIPPARRDYLERAGSLLITRAAVGSGEAELLLMVADDGGVTAFNGHVDMGTGIRTALAQIVAEELDVPVAQVQMVLGDTDTAPNQGPTIASETIQVAAVPLRQAAAQAREHLLALAAATLGEDAGALRIEAGIVRSVATGAAVALGSLLAGRRDRLTLSADAPLKAVAEYRVVGQAVQRVDIPAKVTGQWVYVHDVRLPGMLHGHVVRPPYAGQDSGEFVGTSLLGVDESTLEGLPGIVATVVIGDFVGVVAQREEQAAAGAQALGLTWKPVPELPELGDLQAALLAQPSRPRVLKDTGDVDQRLAQARERLPRTYVWPYQMHGSIGPSCAVADYRADGLTVWSGTQNPHTMRADLALLLGMPEAAIQVVRLEAAGCYGRNCADDVTADAALLSRAVGRPVRVQLTREQEHLWEPKGAAQVMQVDGGLMADGSVAAYDFSTRYPSNASPTLALLLTGIVPPVPAVLEMGDRTAIPAYNYAAMRVVVNDMAPIVRASWLRGVSALPNCFAHESYVDELAAAAHVDPIDFRLRYLDDARAIALIRSVAARAQWEARTGARRREARAGVARGQGFAYARYIHGKFPGTAAAWSAWVAEVEVDLATGALSVTRVVVGQDSGLVINPAGVQHQIHGNVIQSVSRAIKEQVQFDRQAVTSREWGAYPILTFPEVPVIQVVMVPRPDDPPLGAGESASVPSAAAIANAIFDATGVRLREPPFTPERVRAALGIDGPPREVPAPRTPAGARPRAAVLRWLAPFLGGALGMAAALVPLRGAIAPVAPAATPIYAAATLERGRQLAALGNCADCHTSARGAPNAGGRPLATPFGVVYATNITPDVETGIGAWSFTAFARAMREGVHRDGRRLYPVFPYTAFARMSDEDLQALYGYLMAQAPVRSMVPETTLPVPFGLRPLLAFWNALFLRPDAAGHDPARSALWNRGAYLVEGPAHCSACHSPRNFLGAEKTGAQHLGGGGVRGWEAPALTALSTAPVAWTEEAFYDYLRSGRSRQHGAALGPMRAVVRNLGEIPDADIRAMAHYLASLNAPAAPQAIDAAMDAARGRAQNYSGTRHETGARIYAGACAVCHDAVPGGFMAASSSLALVSSLHSGRPDNAVRVILEGVDPHAIEDPTAMPAFANSLDDRQLADLLAYLRDRFAPDKPAWEDLPGAAGRARAARHPDD
jgi:nicotinate dehydrogenase subunit B